MIKSEGGRGASKSKGQQVRESNAEESVVREEVGEEEGEKAEEVEEVEEEQPNC